MKLASVRAYKDKLEEWGYKKYNSRRKLPAAVSPGLAQDLDGDGCMQVASALRPGSNSAMVTTNLMQVKDELERQACVAKDQRMILSKESRKRGRQAMETDVEEVRNSLRTITKLETSISQMRKTLEQVLTPVNIRESRITSCTSCCKPEPITMAYTVLPRAFRLKILVCREIDSIDNFLTVTGEMRIQEKVFKIGIRVPRENLARTRPWSQRSRPGRKFKIGSIFGSDFKPSVVCKRCGLVSEAENDFPLECPNSDCKMAFRTKLGIIIDNLSRRATQDVPTDSTMTRTTLPSDTDLEDLRDEPEASPLRFKKVKIRHSAVEMSSEKQSASKSLIKHKRKNDSQPRRANSTEANDGKLLPW